MPSPEAPRVLTGSPRPPSIKQIKTRAENYPSVRGYGKGVPVDANNINCTHGHWASADRWALQLIPEGLRHQGIHHTCPWAWCCGRWARRLRSVPSACAIICICISFSFSMSAKIARGTSSHHIQMVARVAASGAGPDTGYSTQVRASGTQAPKDASRHSMRWWR